VTHGVQQQSTDKRMLAVDCCRERGWGVGTVLRSAAWAYPVVVLEVGDKFVTTRRAHGAPRSRGGSRERVRSFPIDTTTVGSMNDGE